MYGGHEAKLKFGRQHNIECNRNVYISRTDETSMNSVQVMHNNKKASDFKVDMKDVITLAIQTSMCSCYQMGTAGPVLAPLRTWESCVACSSFVLSCLALSCRSKWMRHPSFSAAGTRRTQENAHTRFLFSQRASWFLDYIGLFTIW
jgi:hypothetical protein